jgi:hypothetical protein
MFSEQALDSLPLLWLGPEKAFANGVRAPLADPLEGQVARCTQNAEQEDDQPGNWFEKQLDGLPFSASAHHWIGNVLRP